MRRDPIRIALSIVDALVAMTAVGGGLALAAGLEGARFPLDWLAGTPFRDYVAPGLILAVIVGGSALAATIAILRDAALGARASIVAGLVVVGWIVGEIVILTGDDERVSPTEVVYLALGLLMIALGLVVTRRAQSTGMQG